MNDIKISILTASYNYENCINEAIESVISQTYDNWELIIVDDGSTDNSVKVIQSYCEKDSRIKLYKHENGENKGLKETILLGLKKCEGDFVAFLESDDLFLPNYLEKKVKVIKENPNIDLIFSAVEMFGEQSEIDGYQEYFSEILGLIKKHKYPCELNKDFLRSNIIPTFSCVMVKKNLLLNCNFNSAIRPFLDWYLWTQISAKKAQFYFCDEKLSKWRMHKTSYVHNVIPFSEKIKLGNERVNLFLQNKPTITTRIACYKYKFYLLRREFFRLSFKPFSMYICGKWFGQER